MATKNDIADRSGRTPFRPIQACAIWLAATLAFTIMGSLLVSIWYVGVLALGLILYLALPIALLIWMVRRRAWRASAALVVAWIGLVWCEAPLDALSRRLHFLVQKPAYDRLVARAAAGHLPGLGEREWKRDPASGVRYRLESEKPVHISFRWSENSGGTDGIEYDDRLRSPSITRNGPPKLLQAKPIGKGYGYYRLIF